MNKVVWEWLIFPGDIGEFLEQSLKFPQMKLAVEPIKQNIGKGLQCMEVLNCGKKDLEKWHPKVNNEET